MSVITLHIEVRSPGTRCASSSAWAGSTVTADDVAERVRDDLKRGAVLLRPPSQGTRATRCLRRFGDPCSFVAASTNERVALSAAAWSGGSTTRVRRDASGTLRAENAGPRLCGVRPLLL
jgi:hypothetical protein